MPPVEQLYAENIELKLELAKLRAQIEYYKRKLFGGGQGEKMDRAQMLLALGELEAAAQKAAELETITCQREKASAQAKRERERDREAFEKLPVTETVVIEPEEVKADPNAVPLQVIEYQLFVMLACRRACIQIFKHLINGHF